MISDIRKTLQTRPVKIFLWLLVASFFIGIIPLAFRMGRFQEDSIGTVNGETITLFEFRRRFSELQNLIKEIRQAYGTQADMAMKQWGLNKRPDEMALEALISEKLMKSLVTGLGAQVDYGYLQTKLHDSYFVREHLSGVIPPQALVDGTIDTTALEYNLQRQGISHEEFDEMLQNALLQALMQKLIEGGIYTTDAALKNAFIGRSMKKKYSYFTVPNSRYITKAKEQKLSDADITNYYAQHKEEYRIPEKRSAKVWTFLPNDFEITVTDKDIETAYQADKREFLKTETTVLVQHILLPFTKDTKIETRAKAQALYNEVTAKPETFSSVAAKQSQSPDKGSTITIKRNEKSHVFAKEAFGLQKEGISPVVETPEGFEIIKLIDRKEPDVRKIDEVKDVITMKLKREKFASSFLAHAQRVVTQSREEPQILAKFVEQHKGQESKLTHEVLSQQMLNQKLFSLRKNGELGFFEEGKKGYIVELTSVEPSVIPPLDNVKDKIAEKIYTERGVDQLFKDLKAGLVDLRKKKITLEQFAKTFNAKVESTDWIVLANQGSAKQFEQLKIQLPLLATLTEQDAVTGGLTDENGYIVQVKEIEPFDETAYKEKKAYLHFKLASQESERQTSALLQTLRERAQISLNNEMLRVAGHM